jgi:hypothetical protein
MHVNLNMVCLWYLIGSIYQAIPDKRSCFYESPHDSGVGGSLFYLLVHAWKKNNQTHFHT